MDTLPMLDPNPSLGKIDVSANKSKVVGTRACRTRAHKRSSSFLYNTGHLKPCSNPSITTPGGAQFVVGRLRDHGDALNEFVKLSTAFSFVLE